MATGSFAHVNSYTNSALIAPAVLIKFMRQSQTGGGNEGEIVTGRVNAP